MTSPDAPRSLPRSPLAPAAAPVSEGASRRTARRSGAGQAGLRLPLLALVLGACNPYVQGNGVLREEPRQVGNFEAISVKDGILATVTAGAAPSVTVSGDENIVRDSFEAGVREDPETKLQMLEVYVSASDFASTHPLRVTVTVPVLKLARASRAHGQDLSRIDARVVPVANLQVKASDGAIIALTTAAVGAVAAQLEVTLSGGAWLDARSCEVTQADVDLTGASRAQLRATVAVNGSIAEKSVLENTGDGPCDGVTASADSTLACR